MTDLSECNFEEASLVEQGFNGVVQIPSERPIYQSRQLASGAHTQSVHKVFGNSRVSQSYFASLPYPFPTIIMKPVRRLSSSDCPNCSE